MAISVDQDDINVTIIVSNKPSITVTEKGPKGDAGVAGVDGPTGPAGPAGEGFAAGGSENQFIQKNSATDYDTKWSAYTLPAADGAEGTVLTTDGAGTVLFAHPQTIAENVKNVSGGPLLKGTPVHVTGSVGNLAEVIAADAATNYPAHFVLNEDLDDDEEGLGIALGFINNVNVPDASIYTEGQTVYLGAAGGWVTSKPTGTNAIQNLGVIIKVNTGGNKISGIVMGAGRANDIPNIPQGNIWAGNSSSVATATDTAYIDIANSRVGIGTTTPEESLQVTPSLLVGKKGFSTPVSGQLRVASPNASYGELGFTSQYDNFPSGIRSYGLSSNYNRDLRFYTKNNVSADDGLERMRITYDGNVGIGTTSPSYKLDVAGDIIARDTYPTIYLDHSGTVLGGLRTDALNKLELKTLTTAPLSFQVNSSEKMRITDSGNVGIGTTSPSEKLHVVGKMNLNDGSNNVLISSENSTITASNTTAVGYQALTALTTGVGNTAIGYQSGNALTSGGANTLVGYESGNQISGGSNTIVGYQAGQSPQGSGSFFGFRSGQFAGGFNNTAVGYEALKGVSGSSGFSNTVAIGYQALTALTTGTGNTAVGYSSNSTTTSGSSNTVIGYEATSGTASSNNTVVGYQAGFNHTSTYGNSTYVGYKAGSGFSGDDDQCVMVGSQAGQSNMGAWGVGVGYQANYNTSGYGIIGIGHQSNRTNSGAYSVALGWRAGYNSSGENAIRIGKQSGETSTGANTIAIGAESLKVTTANNTVAIGYQALTSLTTGSSNIAIGYQAGDSVTTGSYNTILGYQAGQAVTTANHNTFIGRAAGINSTGEGNTYFGADAGYNKTGGNNSVIIGRRAGLNSSSAGGCIFIGYEAGAGETTDNKLYIENSNSSTPLIYGEFDNDLVRVNGKFEADSVTIDDEGMSAAGDYGKGAEIWYQGTSTVAAGYCYMLDSSGNWASAQANAVGTTQGMLAISAGTDSDVDGMVVRGFVQLANNIGGSVGDIVYLNESSAGRLSTTKPTGAGNFVRRVGYLVKGLNTIYFNPSNEYEAL